MILAHEELQELIKAGVIRNTKPDAVNGTSIDLHLNYDLLVENTAVRHGWAVPTVDLAKRESPSFKRISLTQEFGYNGYTIPPGGFVLANTVEVFDLPNNISAQFLLKSSLARSGLSHALATWADPGWNNSTLTLELHNLLQAHGLRIQAGMPIGQMIFHRHAAVPVHASYATRGRYNNDRQSTQQKL